MHTLLFHQPGHFHAALLLKWPNPRIDRTVHVHAEPGPDLDRFVSLVTGFNSRSEDPTDWDLRLHTPPGRGSSTPDDSLRQLIDERRGRVAVVAGRNDSKLATMAALHRAGFAVLADKPWILDRTGVADLERVTAGPPIVMDVMTGRHDIVNRLTRRIVTAGDLFGRFAGRRRDGPDLEFGSVHHLCKFVDGEPLIRPPWYYDIGVQGDGTVDIHSHLVDQAQWLATGSGSGAPGSGGTSGGTAEPQLERAGRWSTEVPLADFSESTGLAEFPAALADRITETTSGAQRGPVLNLACNGLIEYRIGGVSIRQRTEWRVRTPVGGSDLHSFTARGTLCRLDVNNGPETGHRSEIRLTPVDPERWAARLAGHLDRWQGEFPGLAAHPIDGGHRLIIPQQLATPHESTFRLVLEDFLDRVDDRSWSADIARTIRHRYRLLANAHELAVRAPEQR